MSRKMFRFKEKNKKNSVNVKGSFGLLYQLYTIHSPSRGEHKLKDFIQNFLKKYGIPYRICPSTGCIFYCNTGQPLLSAHLDQVQIQAPSLADLIEEGDKIYAPGFGLGADDKNGIWIILNELYYRKIKEEPMPSFLFSVEEECASGKSEVCFTRNFVNVDGNPMVPFCIVLDRRGKGDIIGAENGYCSYEFEQAIEEISNKHNRMYKPTVGVYSDADHISNYVNCVNLSVGYYNPHTTKEETSKLDIMRAWNFVRDILNAREELSKIPFEGKVEVDIWGGGKKKWDNWGSKYFSIDLTSDEVDYLAELLAIRESEVLDDMKYFTKPDQQEKIKEEYEKITSILEAIRWYKY